MINLRDIDDAYTSLSNIVIQLEDEGQVVHPEIKEKVKKLGDVLIEYIKEAYSNVISAKPEEKIKKTDEVEEAIPKIDYDYQEKALKEKYANIWCLLEENSKRFLVTAGYLLDFINVYYVDCSPIVLEFAKALENEIDKKIYYHFIIKNSYGSIKPKIMTKDPMWDAIDRYKNDHRYFFPFGMMFASLNKPKNETDTYYCLLHQELTDNGWDMTILTDESFVKEGGVYAETYRNVAAHTSIINEKKALTCEEKTTQLLNTLLSAYPKNK